MNLKINGVYRKNNYLSWSISEIHNLLTNNQSFIEPFFSYYIEEELYWAKPNPNGIYTSKNGIKCNLILTNPINPNLILGSLKVYDSDEDALKDNQIFYICSMNHRLQVQGTLRKAEN